jgi:hypothetical protein
MDNVIPMPEPLDKLAAQIHADLDANERDQANWIQRTLRIAGKLAEARERFQKDNNAFGYWLVDVGLDRIDKNDRIGYLGIAANPAISCRVLAETTRRSIQLIWREEIEPSLPSARKTPVDPPQPAKPVEASTNPAPIATEPNGETAESEVPKVKRGGGRPCNVDKLPKAALVKAHVLERHTTSMLGSLPPKLRTSVWNLLIESIESGAHGPPQGLNLKRLKDGKIGLRLILPWLSSQDLQHYDLRDFDLTKEEHRTNIRKYILPVAAEHRENVWNKPEAFARLINKARIEREDIAREQARQQKIERTLAKPIASGEQPIIAYGVPLWPVLDGLTPQYSYDELCHAIWFVQYLLPLMRNEATPQGKALTARHLIKFVSPLAAVGWGNAARDFLSAYENNPEGECRLPGYVNRG